MMEHVYNLSYSGDGGRTVVLGCPMQKQETLSEKQTKIKKDSSEFNPQYCKDR
jgi:hypothetical protein